MLAWLLYSRQFQCFSNSDKQLSRSLVMLSMRERNAAAHGESRMEMPDTGAGHVQILRAARHPSALFQAMRGVPVFGFAKHEVLCVYCVSYESNSSAHLNACAARAHFHCILASTAFCLCPSSGESSHVPL